MKTDKSERDITEFAHALDVCGGDPQRWPDGKRDAFRRLLVNDARARVLYSEAQALDTLLDKARRVPSKEQEVALTARVLSSAMARSDAGRVASGRASAEVIRLPARTHGTGRPRPAARFRELWQVAAVLVASLLVGVLAGTSSNMNSVVQDMADSVGLAAPFETTSVAWQDAAGEFYEDTL